jgi:hypothetical protein
LQLSDLGGHPLVYHGGGHKGVAACAGFAAAEGVVCAVLTNLAETPVEGIWTACMRAALGLPPGPLFEPPTPIDLDIGALRSFAGVYQSLEAGRLSVIVDDAGGVVVQAEGGGALRARPVVGDALVFAGPQGAEQTIRFLRLNGPHISHALHGGRVIKRSAPREETPR